LALRVLLPSVFERMGDEAIETSARLAMDARTRGRSAWLRYWMTEFRSLARTAWRERPPRKGALMIPTLLQDVRYSLRLLRRTPGMTFIALVTLALGIGANTAIFSLVNDVLLRPLAYADPDRLFLIQHALITDRTQVGSATPGNFYDLQRACRLMQPMAAFSSATATMTGRGDPERLQGIESSGSILEVLGVAPAIGRIFTEADDRIGVPKVIVISHEIWQRLFGGS